MLRIICIFLILCVTLHANSYQSCNQPASFKRISEEKCYEYKQQIAKTSYYGHRGSSCRKTYECPKGRQFIVGGEKTNTGEFPHMAAIGWKTENGAKEFKCGGSLISERYVLTAAHCCPRYSEPSFVRLGEQNLASSSDGARPVEIAITKCYKHPDYHSIVEVINDIALLKLERNVWFNSFIRPACLHQDKNVEEFVFATGWGYTEKEKPSDELMKVRLPIRSSENCIDSFELDEFLDSQICVGGVKGKDTCQGDSGGPIQFGHRDAVCVYNIIGLTSYGSLVCGLEMPAVYTRVSSFIDWIEEIVWPQNV